MAWTVTNRAAAADPVGRTAYTAIPTLTPSRLILVTVVNSSAATTPTISDTLALTWTQVNTRDQGLNTRITLFRAVTGGSAGADTITVDFGGITQARCAIAVDEIDGADLTTPVIQSAVNSANSGASLSVTLATFASTANLAWGSFGQAGTAASTFTADTAPAGWVKDSGATGGNSVGTQHLVGQDLTVTGTFSVTTVRIVGIAAELKASQAALAGVSTALSVSTAALSQARPLQASDAATSSSTATLTVLAAGQLAGRSVAVSVSAAALSVSVALFGASAGLSVSTAALRQARPIDSTSTALSASTAALGQARPIQATSTAVSTSVATLYAPANWNVWINGVDRTAYVRPFDAVSIVNRLNRGSGTASIPIRDDAGSLTIANEQVVKIIQRDTRLFEGIVRRVNRTDKGWSTGPAIYTLECQDYDTLLTDDVIDTSIRTVAESDKARVTWLVNTWGTRGVTAGAEVQQTLASMPAGTDGRPEQDFGGKTLRQAIEQVCAITGASFYVDYDKKLHYYLTESATAPYKLSDTYNGTTSVGYWDLNLNDDSIDLVHEVLVVGTGVKIWRQVGGAPPVGQRRRAVITDDKITTLAQANAAGDAYLNAYGTTRDTGSVMTRAPGFRAGQTVLITHQGHGLVDQPYTIASVTAQTASPDVVNFSLELNDSPLDLAEVLGQLRKTIVLANANAAGAAGGLVGLDAAGRNRVINSSHEDQDDDFSVPAGVTFITSTTALHGDYVARIQRSAATLSDFTQAARIPIKATNRWWAGVHLRRVSHGSGILRVELREYSAVTGGSLLATTTIADLTSADTVDTVDFDPFFMRFGGTTEPDTTLFDPNTKAVLIVVRTTGSSTLEYHLDGWQLSMGKIKTEYSPRPQEITKGSVDRPKLGPKAVGGSELDDLAVGSGHIQPIAINTGHLQPNSVTNPKVAPNAVDEANIVDDGVAQIKMRNNAVLKLVRSFNINVSSTAPNTAHSVTVSTTSSQPIFLGGVDASEGYVLSGLTVFFQSSGMVASRMMLAGNSGNITAWVHTAAGYTESSKSFSVFEFKEQR